MAVWRGLWLVLVVLSATVGAAVTLLTCSATAQTTAVSLGGLVAVICARAKGNSFGSAQEALGPGRIAAAAALGGGIGWVLIGPLAGLGQVTLTVTVLLTATSPAVVRRLVTLIDRLGEHGDR